MGTFFVCQKRLVHFFAMTDTDNLDSILVATEKFAHSFCLSLDCASRSLLHQDVARDAVLKSEQHQIYRFVEAHDKTSHGTFGYGNRLARANLVNPQRNHRTAAAHHITVTRAAYLCLFRAHRAGLGHNDLFHHCLARTHRVHRISSLVRAQANHVLDTFFDGGGQHVVRTEHVGLDSFEREKFAARHLLEGCSMENVVHPVHGILDTLEVAHVTNVKLDFVCYFRHFRLKLVTHVILFFFITAKNTDFPYIGLEEAVENGIAETTCTTSNQERLTTEDGI